MIVALSQMDPTVQGIFFLIAVILCVVAALATKPLSSAVSLFPLGVAFAFFVFMWNAFAAS